MDEFIKSFSDVFPPPKEPEVLNNSKQLAHLEQLEEKPFPFETFEGTLIGEMALALKTAYDAPLSASCMVFLGMQSACLGRDVIITGGYTKPSYPNLYIIIGADSGQFKSNVYDAAKSPVDDWQAEENQKIQDKKATNELITEELRKKLKDAVKGSEDELAKAINSDQRIYDQLDRDAVQQALNKHEENCSPKVIYLQDATPEAVEVLAQQNGGCIAIFNDEGVRVLSMMGGRYSPKAGTDLSLYNSLWSSSSLNTFRIDKDRTQVSCPAATGSMVVLSQPPIVDRMIQQEDTRFQGLLGRLLAHKVGSVFRPDDGQAVSVPQELAHRWRDHIYRLLDSRYSDGEPTEIVVSEDAREYLRLFHNRLGEGAEDKYATQPCAYRAREQAIRVGGNLAVIKNTDVIDLPLAKAACAIVEWHLENMIEIMTTEEYREKTDKAERLVEIIEANDEKMGKRQAMQQINLNDQKFMLLMKHPLLVDYCIWNEGRKLWLSHHTLRPNDREEAS